MRSLLTRPVLSRPFLYKDLESTWYKRWSKELKQDSAHKGKFEANANKFWQNAVMAELLHRKGMLAPGKKGLVFGVGEERLPALFAKYAVRITATDQDPTKQRASQWTNDQLARGLNSLNKLRICNRDEFNDRVVFEPADMRKIPKKYAGKYDFVWTNCALGHLGSIQKGLDFIAESAACLAPGGMAVHTTELNFLSDEDTLDNADTVFFRLKDIRDLHISLARAGYICEPFILTLQSTKQDAEFTLQPKWGSKFSKILFDGHMATQIVLCIRKPEAPLTTKQVDAQIKRHNSTYKHNLRHMKRFITKNIEIKHLALAQRPFVPSQQSHINSHFEEMKVGITRGKQKKVKVRFTNTLDYPLFGQNVKLRSTTPFVLATTSEVNRESVFRDESWWSENRPSVQPIPDNKNRQFVQPGDEFFFEFMLDSKMVEKGEYQEDFCIVAEGVGVIEKSEFTLRIQVR